MTPKLLPAFGLAMLAMASLTGMDAVAKFLSSDFSTMQIVFMRYLGPALALGAFIVATGGAWPQRRFFLPALARAVFIALTGFFFFFAIAALPLATVTAIAMTGPVLTALLGVFVLGEDWNRSLSVAMALALAGALVIVLGAEQSPIFADGDLSAWIAALLAPVTYAATVILLKMHAVQEGTLAIGFGQAVLVSLIVAPFAIPGLIVPTGDQWWPVIGIGVLGLVGMLSMTRALRDLPASMFSFVDYLSPVWAAAFGYIFFSEWPAWPVWIGAGMIIAGCAFAAARKRLKQTTIVQSPG